MTGFITTTNTYTPRQNFRHDKNIKLEPQNVRLGNVDSLENDYCTVMENDYCTVLYSSFHHFCFAVQSHVSVSTQFTLLIVLPAFFRQVDSNLSSSKKAWKLPAPWAIDSIGRKRNAHSIESTTDTSAFEYTIYWKNNAFHTLRSILHVDKICSHCLQCETSPPQQPKLPVSVRTRRYQRVWQTSPLATGLDLFGYSTTHQTLQILQKPFGYSETSGVLKGQEVGWPVAAEWSTHPSVALHDSSPVGAWVYGGVLRFRADRGGIKKDLPNTYVG